MKRILVQYLISAFLVTTTLCAEKCAPRVITQLGKVKGFYKVSYKGRKYEAYEGIPFAKPPTGELRFQPPQPVDVYDHEIDATKQPNICPQYDLQNKVVIGNEDCLYLNVYTPRQKGTTPLPIIFYIYGGAFQWGSGTETRAKYIMDRDVILVTLNYRLGPFGFLSSRDEVISGNMGLKDQTLALRWVNNNIRFFGGDPKKVTIMGNSAGGVSVHLHYMSPLSAGLFQSGYSSSGTALLTSAFDLDGSGPMKKFANASNCPHENTRRLLECLKSKSFEQLSVAYGDVMEAGRSIFDVNGTAFLPVVEKSSKNYFINKAPLEYLETGQIYDAPWITGVVSEEGLSFVADYVANDTIMSYIDEHWESMAPYVLLYSDEVPKKRYVEIADKAKKHYLGDKPISKESLRDFARLLGDRIILAHAERAAKLQAKANRSPVRFYYYSYKAAQRVCDAFLGAANNFGVCHTDDVMFVFENPSINPVSTKQDRAMLGDVLDLWYAIASIKDSNLKNWVKVNHSSKLLNYLEIGGPKNFTSRSTDNFADKKFWKSIGLNP